MVRLSGGIVVASAIALTSCTTVAAPVTDSQYVIVIERLTCEGACNLGEAKLRIFVPGGRDTTVGESFEIDEERTYNVHFGYRFDGRGVRWGIHLLDQDEILVPVLTVEDGSGEVTLNGPQQRGFQSRINGRNELTTFRIAYYLYRADP